MSLSGEAGTISLADTIFEVSAEQPYAGVDQFGLKIHTALVRNLDTVKLPMALLDVAGPYTLNNTLSIGSVTDPVGVSFSIAILLVGDGINISDSLVFSLESSSIDLFLSSVIKMFVNVFEDIHVGDLSSTSFLLDFISSLDDKADIFFIDFGELSYNISCADCLDVGMQELPFILLSLSDEISFLFGELSKYFSSFTSPNLGGIDEMVNVMERNFMKSRSRKSLGFAINEDNWEILVLSGVIMLEVLIPCTAITMEANPFFLNPLPYDPSIVEASFEKSVANGKELLDFSKGLTNRLIEGVANLLKAEKFVTDFINSLESNNSSFIEISPNVLLTSDGASIVLSSIRLFGLNSLSNLTFDVIGKRTMSAGVSVENIAYEFEFVVNIPASSSIYDNSLEERIIFKGEINDMKLTMALLLAVDASIFGNIELGSLLYQSNILPCFLSTIDTLNITHFNLNMGAMTTPRFNGFKSSMLEEIINNTTETIFSEYGSIIQKVVPRCIDYFAKRFFNSAFDRFIHGNCPPPLLVNHDDVVDLRLIFDDEDTIDSSHFGDIFPEMFHFLHEELFKKVGSGEQPYINEAIIRPLTRAQSNHEGSLVFNDIFNTNALLDDFGIKNIMFDVKNIHINNLDTVGYNTYLLQPKNSHTVTNDLRIGEAKPLEISTNIAFSIEGDDIVLVNDILVNLELNDLRAFFSFLLMMDTNSILQFPLNDIPNAYCWLSTIKEPSIGPTFSVLDLQLKGRKINLSVECNNCSSSGIIDLQEILDSGKFSENLTNIFNQADGLLVDFLSGSLAQTLLDQLVLDSKTKCNRKIGGNQLVENSLPDLRYTNESMESIIILSAILLSCLIVWLASTYTDFKLDNNWFDGLSNNERLLIAADKEKRLEFDRFCIEQSDALLHSNIIPLSIRILIPFMLFLNIGFFISGHLSVGATVNVDVNFAGQLITISDFFQFSMAQSTLDMWEAGAKELAVIIVFFSGIWPYTKQLLTLALWCSPPRLISPSRRGSILVWLDALAKWSMIDVFMLIISLAAFRLSFQNPEISFIPDSFYSVELMVIPLWGLYSNMIAQLLSQVTSHVVIYYHRKVVTCVTEFTSNSMSDVDPAPRSVHQDRFLLNKGIYILRPRISIVIKVISILIFILIVGGCIVPSFQFEILGLLGIAVEIGDGPSSSTIKHSLFTIIELIFDQASYSDNASDYIGLGTLNIIFFVTVLMMPLMQIIVLMRMYFVSHSLQSMKELLHAFELVKAWQYCDVYLITVLFTVLQLGEISTFMVNDYCDMLQNMFNFATHYGFLAAEDAQCFYVDPTIRSGFYILLVAVLLLHCLSKFVHDIVMSSYTQRVSEVHYDLHSQLNSDSKKDPLNMAQLFSSTYCQSSKSQAPSKELICLRTSMSTLRFRWALIHIESGVDDIDDQPNIKCNE